MRPCAAIAIGNLQVMSDLLILVIRMANRTIAIITELWRLMRTCSVGHALNTHKPPSRKIAVTLIFLPLDSWS